MFKNKHFYLNILIVLMLMMNLAYFFFTYNFSSLWKNSQTKTHEVKMR